MPLPLQITDGTVQGQRVRVTVEIDVAGVEDCGSDPTTGEHVYRLRDLPALTHDDTRIGFNALLATCLRDIRGAIQNLDDAVLQYGITVHNSRVQIETDVQP